MAGSSVLPRDSPVPVPFPGFLCPGDLAVTHWYSELCPAAETSTQKPWVEIESERKKPIATQGVLKSHLISY